MSRTPFWDAMDEFWSNGCVRIVEEISRIR